VVQRGIRRADYTIDGKFDVDRFVEETLEDFSPEYRAGLDVEERGLVVILYHLNALPRQQDYGGITSFKCRHRFRDALYVKEKDERDESAVVYLCLLQATLDTVEPELFEREPYTKAFVRTKNDLGKAISEQVYNTLCLGPALRQALQYLSGGQTEAF
jgi:hypothetical protein